MPRQQAVAVGPFSKLPVGCDARNIHKASLRLQSLNAVRAKDIRIWYKSGLAQRSCCRTVSHFPPAVYPTLPERCFGFEDWNECRSRISTVAAMGYLHYDCVITMSGVTSATLLMLSPAQSLWTRTSNDCSGQIVQVDKKSSGKSSGKLCQYVTDALC